MMHGPPLYSVMQSDGSSFSGEVVMDSFSRVYSDEGRFKTKNIKKRFYWDLYFENFRFREGLKKIMFKEIQHIATRNS